MAYRENEIDIRDLQNVPLTLGNLKDIVTLLECSVNHLLLPPEATAALDRLVALKGERR
jgi:hypothetical protein